MQISEYYTGKRHLRMCTSSYRWCIVPSAHDSTIKPWYHNPEKALYSYYGIDEKEWASHRFLYNRGRISRSMYKANGQFHGYSYNT